MRHFQCDHCGKQSRFLKQKRKRSMVAEMQTAFSLDQTRSYDCEWCNEENRITQPMGAWTWIDAQSNP